MDRVLEKLGEAVEPRTVVNTGHRIAQPIKGLHYPHGWATGPVQLAGGSLLERDSEIAECDCFCPRVRMNDCLRWHGIREAEIVGGGHAIDQHPDLVAARNGIDNGFRIGGAILLRKAVIPGLVVKPAIDTAQTTPFDEALQRLVDGVATGEIEEVARRPDTPRHTTVNAIEDLRLEAGQQGIHVRNL